MGRDYRRQHHCPGRNGDVHASRTIDAAEERLEVRRDAIGYPNRDAWTEQEVRQRRIQMVAADIAVMHRSNIRDRAEPFSEVHDELPAAAVGAEGGNVAG